MKIFKKHSLMIPVLISIILPVVSFAAATTTTASCTLAGSAKLGDLFNYVTCIILSSVIPLIILLALVMFIWGVVQYLINAQEETKREKGKQFMIWGIIALTVMTCVWGLVSIVGTTFGIQNVIPRTAVQ